MRIGWEKSSNYGGFLSLCFGLVLIIFEFYLRFAVWIGRKICGLSVVIVVIVIVVVACLLAYSSNASHCKEEL